MKTETRKMVRKWSAAVATAAGCLLLGGCLEQCVVWAPDGQRAAVIVGNDLRLCGTDGKLTEVLAEGVYRVAWLRDSQQLVLARKHPAASWAEIARAAGTERAAALAARGEAVWQKLQTGAPWGSVKPMFEAKGAALMRLYLRERYGEAMRTKVGSGEWEEFTKQAADVHELVLARRDGDKIVPGTQLFAGLGAVRDIRVAPGDRAIAFTAEAELEKRDALQLFVARPDTAAPELVAERVTASPDWTPDGRALVYLQASGAPVGKDDLLLGVLVRRGVLEASGKIKIDAEPQPLAGAIFDDSSRVRCLKDGRVLFNVAEISLPVAAEDFGGERQQLFAFDPARQATLVRLIPRKHEEKMPGALGFFEVSPDEKQVLFGSFRGEVAVLTLASGEVDQVQTGGKEKEGIQGAPVWRADGAITYTRRAGAKDGVRPGRVVEMVVRHGDKEQALSASWPDELVNRLFSEGNE